jgi:hypothetical protein
MKSTTATFASLVLAVAVVGFTATVESQDKAPAPVVEGQDQKASTPFQSQEKTPGPTPVESQDKAAAPVVEGQDQKPSTPLESQENAAALPPSVEKTPGPTVPSPDQAAPGESQDQKSVVASEIVVYASDLSERALFEFEFWPSRQSPGGKMVGTIQTGDKLNPPPEEDPYVTIKVKVQGGVPYRCWIRMMVGEPLGISQANRLYVQISNAVDKADKDVFRPNTASYLTVQGPLRQGWRWLPCEADPKSTDSLIYFRESREVTVKVQAGMEGVGFDQFVLSPAQFLEKPPAEAIVKK